MVAATALTDGIHTVQDKRVYNPFENSDYAASSQHVINGYGVADETRLRAARKAHKPEGLFHRAVPGCFQLFDPMGPSDRATHVWRVR